MRPFIRIISRCLLCLSVLLTSVQAFALFVDSKTQDNTVYFLFSAPNKIARYDMASQSQAMDIALAKVPTAFAVANGKAYVAFHRELREVDLATGSSVFVRNASSDVINLTLLNGFIYATESTGIVQIIKVADFSLVASDSYSYRGAASNTPSSEHSAIYSRSTGVSPSDIEKMTVAADGKVINVIDSPYHGSYPGADKLYLNASQSKIYDNAGIVYFSADLTYAGSLAGSVDSLAFVGDNPVLLRDKTLILLSASHIEQGTQTLAVKPDLIASYAQKIFAFKTSDSGLTVEVADLSAIELPEPGEPANPVGLNYQAEFIQHDGADTIYFIDRETLSIFRWSVSQNNYLSSWSLLNPPTWASYSAAHQRLYLAYESGKISYMDADAAGEEKHFANLPGTTRGLLATDNYLFAVDNSGAWATHYSFAENGTLLTSEDWAYIGNQYVWNPVTQRVYHHRDDTSPNDIVWREIDTSTGLFRVAGESPYHGDTLKVRYPLVVSNDGELLVNGAGQIIDAYSGQVLNALSNSITSAAWINNQLTTISESPFAIQFWNSNYSLDSSFVLSDTQNAQLLNINNDLVLVQQTASGPKVTRYDINNLPDTDEDGVHNLKDNCLAQKNTDQLDSDADGEGNACDSDDDNDGLPDEIEIAAGLNSLDSSDAELDLDGDSYSNRVEFLLGSELNNNQSMPVALSRYSENFDAGWPKGFYIPVGKLPWTVQAAGYNSTKALRSTAFHTANTTSEVAFTALFSNTRGSFRMSTSGNNNYSYRLKVLVDNQEVLSTYGDYNSTNWSTQSFAVTPGVHTIIFRVEADYLWGHESDVSFSIDDFSFDIDTDSDNIIDQLDNCPANYNPWQADADNDAIGDDCDNDPYSQDRDGDGYGDVRDNCPELANPTQADIDSDNIGDACDPSDNRPKDSDRDGVYDDRDNCEAHANPLQENLDGDAQGNACDDDADDDGISALLEAKYPFLSDLNAADALLDQDGDGVANRFELRSGFAPDKTDNHPVINLFDYYLVGDIEYTYLSNSGTYRRDTIKKSATKDQFIMTSSDGWTSTMERRSDGFYIVAGSYDLPDYKATYVYKNWLLVPKALKLGQGINNPSASIEIYDADKKLIYDMKFRRSIQIVEIGERSWKGKTYPSVTLQVIEEQDETYMSHYSVTYLKGLGSVGSDEFPLDSAVLTQVDKPAVENTGGNNSEGKSGGGGSTSLWLLLLLTGLVGYYPWRRC